MEGVSKSYVTVCSTNDYIQGVLILNSSLKLVNSVYQLACLVPSTMDEQKIRILECHGVIVKKINKAISTPEEVYSKNKKMGSDYWNNTFFKFFVFSLIEYEKIVFVDADMIVLKNIDELFDKPHMTSVCAGKLYPGNEDWVQLNSGIMVIEPKETLTQKLMILLNDSRYYDSYRGDQDVIGKMYSDWPKKTELQLPETYNLFYPYINYYVDHYGYSLEGDNAIRIVHYAGKTKPWMYKIPLKKRIRKILSYIRHPYRWLFVYKKSTQYKIDQYYQRIVSLIDQVG